MTPSQPSNYYPFNICLIMASTYSAFASKGSSAAFSGVITKLGSSGEATYSMEQLYAKGVMTRSFFDVSIGKNGEFMGSFNSGHDNKLYQTTRLGFQWNLRQLLQGPKPV
jgi:hypothetical protein